ncbi:MAG TPA: serine/threonine-protein kinase, partial [Blastocatellia bacterium]|nr:serine/threonine-protein kinase [Blastocatellia bacterium]
RHSALPVVMDYFSVGERQFLVMQYIPGMDLEQLLAERKERGQKFFATGDVLTWADQILDAVEYLHSQKQPIIHRDIKPQNLKLTPRGEVILLDFGLAKGITNQQSQVSQSVRGYSPNYAPLEQIRGTGTDARSDIYSLGATLYNLLTGEMPPDALSRTAAVLMGQPDPLAPIGKLNPQVPPAVAAAVEKAMAQHPDQRYSSAAVMRQALRNAVRNTAPIERHRSPTLINRPLKSDRASAAVAAAAAFERHQRPAPAASREHMLVMLDENKQEMPKVAVQAPASGQRPTPPVKRPEAKRNQPVARPPLRSRMPLHIAIAAGFFISSAAGVFFYLAGR